MSYNWIAYTKEQEEILLKELNELTVQNSTINSNLCIFSTIDKNLIYRVDLIEYFFTNYNKTVSQYGKIVNDYLGIPPGRFIITAIYKN